MRRFARFLAFWRRERDCCYVWLDDPPPDSFVREPRKPRPQSSGGAVALELPTDLV